MPEETETIVITAKVSNGSGPAQFAFSRLLNQQNRQPSTWVPPQGVPPSYRNEPASPGVPVGGNVTVNVQVAVANQADGVKAAENLTKALLQVVSLLQGTAPDTPIQWFEGADVITAQQALSELNNTVFLITDVRDYRNGGVGAADRGEDGRPNTITWYFDSFDGDSGDYADPNYSNGQGMVAILLHDLGHVTAPGALFNQLSEAFHRRQYGSRALVPFERYWYNNEAYAHDFAQAAAAAVGFDISQFRAQLDY